MKVGVMARMCNGKAASFLLNHAVNAITLDIKQLMKPVFGFLGKVWCFL